MLSDEQVTRLWDCLSESWHVKIDIEWTGEVHHYRGREGEPRKQTEWRCVVFIRLSTRDKWSVGASTTFEWTAHHAPDLDCSDRVLDTIRDAVETMRHMARIKRAKTVAA